MKRRALALLLTLFLVPFAAQAAQADHIKASHAWIRLLPPALPVAGYVTLDNQGSSSATLVSADSTGYASVMLHESTIAPDGNDTMRMLDHLVIPAHGQVALAPAGSHLMLQQATRPWKPGDTVAITLRFADGSSLSVPFLVRPAYASN